MSNIVSRFQFPGFTVLRTEDTATHEVEVGTIASGGHTFVVTMLRKKGFEKLHFLVASVDDAAEENLWKFKSENFFGVGVLAKADDEIVVALMGSGKEGKVQRVIPFSTFVGGNPDLRRLTALKKTAGEYLGRDCVMSSAEELLLRVDQERRQAEEEAARRNAEEARIRARAEKVAAVLARPVVTGYTTAGGRRYGHPALESEWQSLPHDTNVVLVESIDETGKVGALIEAFKVHKGGGKNPKKEFATPVVAAPPTSASQLSQQAIKPVRSTVVETADGAREVQLYRSMDEIRAARAAGLNGGAYVAVERPAGLKIEVYSVRADGVTTIGNFVPLG